MRTVVLVTALAAVLGGCAAPVAGAPSAAPTVRPREVRLDGVDTCTLLTSAQVAQLGLEGSGLKNTHDVDDSCSWSGFEPRAISTLISAVTSHGIDGYDRAPGRISVSPISTRDFPALQLSVNGRGDSCAVWVDTAPGQVIDIQFSAYSSNVPIPLADLCSGARQVADDAVVNLLAQR